MRRLLFGGLLLLVALGARAAWAAPRAMVLRVEFEGRMPNDTKAQLSQDLLEGLADAGFEVSAGDVLRNQQDKLPAPDTCRTEDCYKIVASRLGLDYLVIAHISVREKNYDLRLQLVRGSDGRPAGEDMRERCELCGIKEVGEKLDTLARSLLTAALEERKAAAPARLTVQSEPVGASVTIDGRSAGETPLSVDLPPASHNLAMTAAGHVPVHRKITLDPGIRALISIGLIPLPGGGAPPPTLSGRHWLGVGLAALAVGAAAVGGGIGALTQDHKPATCVSPGTQMNDQCTLNTRLLAGLLMGAGGMTMIGGGFCVYVGWGALSAPGDTVLAQRPALFLHGRF